MADAETGAFIADDSSLDLRVANLIKTLMMATHQQRISESDRILQIIKTIRVDAVSPLIIGIAKVDRVLMSRLATDPVVSSRIAHAYRIAEISMSVSPGVLDKIEGGIEAVRRNIFEISHEK